jgi:hypothetical protein
MLGFSQMADPRTSVVVSADTFAIGHQASLMTIHIRSDRDSRWARTPPGFRIMKEAHA